MTRLVLSVADDPIATVWIAGLKKVLCQVSARGTLSFLVGGMATGTVDWMSDDSRGIDQIDDGVVVAVRVRPYERDLAWGPLPNGNQQAMSTVGTRTPARVDVGTEHSPQERQS